MTRPSLTRDQAIALAGGITDPVFILGVRGFTDAAGGNVKGIYDDALFLVTPDDCIGFNGNTDPSADHPGMAVLQPGTYKYRQGIHGQHHFSELGAESAKVQAFLNANVGKDYLPIPGKILPYWAFRQAGPVTVLRDGQTARERELDPEDWPWIDIHRGGYSTTSSDGCQTCHPDQWPELRAKGYAAMNQSGVKLINYVLVVKA
jgi:lysozyme